MELASLGGYELRPFPSLVGSTRLVDRVTSRHRPGSETISNPAFMQAVTDAAPSADIVHIENLLPSWVGRGLDNSVRFLHRLEIIDAQPRPTRSGRPGRTWRRLQRATYEALTQTRRVIATTSRVVGVARQINPELRTEVVPVCVDPAVHTLLDAPAYPAVGVVALPDVGWSSGAVERVVRELWPRIRESVPEARLVVACEDGAFAAGSRFEPPGVEFCSLAEGDADFFGRIAILLCPSKRASGYKPTVLEAMARGRAVVSNTVGLEGITDRPQMVVMAHESDEELVARTVELLADPELRFEQARNGRDLVENVYAPLPAVDRLEAAYERLGLSVRAGR